MPCPFAEEILMKNKIIAAAAVLGVAVMAGGCVSGGTGISSEAANANPWEDVGSLEEAEEAMGFELTVPDMSEYGEASAYRVCAALTEIEIQYGSLDSKGAYIRKAEDDGDISGDYEKYSYEENVTVGEDTVTFKGTSEDEISLAVWNAGDYAYCIRVTDGIAPDVMNDLVSGVK